MLQSIIDFWGNWLGSASLNFQFFDWQLTTEGLSQLLSVLTIVFVLWLAIWVVYRLVSFIIGLCSRW